LSRSSVWIIPAIRMRVTYSLDGTITSKPGLPALSLENSSSLVEKKLIRTETPVAALKSLKVV